MLTILISRDVALASKEFSINSLTILELPVIT